jgi:hypothetical protein
MTPVEHGEHSSGRTPILVTGAHRSGTTWVGKMLAASNQAAYISEPLNVLHRSGVMITPTHFWYTYICSENETEYLPALQQTIHFHYHAWAEIRSLRSTKDVGRMGRDAWIFLQGRLKRQRPLLKDPFAVFSAPWFASRLGCRVVFTVRHPAGFVSSLKRLDWPFELHDLLNQPLLMRDHLEPYRAELEQLGSNQHDIIGQNSLLWRAVYQVVHRFVSENPTFIVVHHEDLSVDPEKGYRDLYHRLDLDFTDNAKQTILTSSGSENPKELTRRKVHSVQLDSRANVENWKHRLSKEEITRIRELTEDVAALYYPGIRWD